MLFQEKKCPKNADVLLKNKWQLQQKQHCAIRQHKKFFEKSQVNSFVNYRLNKLSNLLKQNT
jgi:hypothetical protein